MPLRRPPIPVVFRLLAGLLLISQGGCMSAWTTAAMREALRDTIDSMAEASAPAEPDRDAEPASVATAAAPPPISEPKPPSLDESVNQAIARLKNVGELDAQTQATLLSILEKTTPEDWPAAIDAFAASLEVYRPQPRAVAPPAAQPARVRETTTTVAETAPAGVLVFPASSLPGEPGHGSPAEQAAATIRFEPTAAHEAPATPDAEARDLLVFPGMPLTPEPARLVVIEAARPAGLGTDGSVEEKAVFAAGTTRPSGTPELNTLTEAAIAPATLPPPVAAAPPQVIEPSVERPVEPSVEPSVERPVEPSVEPSVGEEAAVVVEQPATTPPADPVPPAFSVLRASFVSRVRGWGDVEMFPETVFRPGQDVIVYFELDALAARQIPSGHSTSIDTIFRLRDSDGRQVGQWDFEPIDETCPTRRRDYFARYFVRIPETAAPGFHRLEILVTDLVAGVSSRTHIDLEVRP